MQLDPVYRDKHPFGGHGNIAHIGRVLCGNARAEHQVGELNPNTVVNPKQLALLKASGTFHSVPTASFYDYEFVAVLYAGHMYNHTPMFLYSTQTGELGSGKDWCFVPPTFREWVKTLKSLPPASAKSTKD